MTLCAAICFPSSQTRVTSVKFLSVYNFLTVSLTEFSNLFQHKLNFSSTIVKSSSPLRPLVIWFIWRGIYHFWSYLSKGIFLRHVIQVGVGLAKPKDDTRWQRAGGQKMTNGRTHKWIEWHIHLKTGIPPLRCFLYLPITLTLEIFIIYRLFASYNAKKWFNILWCVVIETHFVINLRFKWRLVNSFIVPIFFVFCLHHFLLIHYIWIMPVQICRQLLYLRVYLWLVMICGLAVVSPRIFETFFKNA